MADVLSKNKHFMLALNFGEVALQFLRAKRGAHAAEFPFLRFAVRFVNFPPLKYELQNLASRRVIVAVAHARD
jgi:hypothetical protein